MNDPVHELTQALERFAAERDWAQFHSPKNLAMALCVESAELLEHFQWLSEDASRALTPAQKGEVAHEVADVLLYLLRLADVVGIDPIAAARDKLQINAERYPAERARGRADKYTAY